MRDVNEKEFISVAEAVRLGLIPSKTWFYHNRPDDFPKGVRTVDSPQGRWYFKTNDLREYWEQRMQPVN